MERLQQSSPQKAAEVISYLNPDPSAPRIPETTPTRHLDCSDLVERISSAAAGGTMTAWRAAVSELEQRPDGVRARECWLAINRFYVDTIMATDWDEFQAFQGYAGVAAATGKAISADPEAARADGALWWRHGLALSELRLPELAVPALERASALQPSHAGVAQMLSSSRELLSMRERGDAEEFVRTAREAARDAARFWAAFELFEEAFWRDGRSEDERSAQSHELHQRAFRLFDSRPDDAIALLCEAAANLPEIAATWQELCSLHFRRREFGPAELFQRYAVEPVSTTVPLPEDAGRIW
jgi:tetratricopeptide (TPR) repeat protein